MSKTFLRNKLTKYDFNASILHRIKPTVYFSQLMLGSHCRFSSIDSESHRQNEECRQVQTKTPCSKNVNDSLVGEVEHVLLLVDFCR